MFIKNYSFLIYFQDEVMKETEEKKDKKDKKIKKMKKIEERIKNKKLLGN